MSIYPSRAASFRHLERVALGLGVLLLVAGIMRIVLGFLTVQPAVGLDLGIYIDRANDFLAGHGFYLSRQLEGPYRIEIGDSLYPPPTLLLFLPFLVIPHVLWWLIPLSVIVFIVAHHRPGPMTWAILGLLVVSDGTLLSVVKGNPAIWVAAALALGTVWRPANALVLMKPSVFPLALIGMRNQRWWAAFAAMAVVSALFLPLWLDYARVILDSDLGIGYSLREVPFLVIPWVAWAGGRFSPLRGDDAARVRAALEATIDRRIDRSSLRRRVWPDGGGAHGLSA